jgi:hypothetical protein
VTAPAPGKGHRTAAAAAEAAAGGDGPFSSPLLLYGSYSGSRTVRLEEEERMKRRNL